MTMGLHPWTSEILSSYSNCYFLLPIWQSETNFFVAISFFSQICCLFFCYFLHEIKTLLCSCAIIHGLVYLFIHPRPTTAAQKTFLRVRNERKKLLPFQSSSSGVSKIKKEREQAQIRRNRETFEQRKTQNRGGRQSRKGAAMENGDP